MTKVEFCPFYNPETQECIIRSQAFDVNKIPSQGREVHRGKELILYCNPGITKSDLPERLRSWQKRCTSFPKK